MDFKTEFCTISPKERLLKYVETNLFDKNYSNEEVNSNFHDEYMDLVRNKLYYEKEFLLMCANKANTVYNKADRYSKHYDIEYDINQHIIYIIFRGTKDLSDIKSDINVGLTSNVHNDMFVDTAQFLFENSCKMYYEILKYKKIYIIGHSLGGGYSIYLLFILKCIFAKKIKNTNILNLFGLNRLEKMLYIFPAYFQYKKRIFSNNIWWCACITKKIYVLI